MVASGVVVPEPVALGLEGLVAIMLVVLGVTGARRALAEMRSLADRTAVGAAPKTSGADSALARSRPFFVGLVHGLAGSAALALTILATVRERALALTYLGVFCAGTIAGMALVTSLLSAPIASLAGRVTERGLSRLALGAGLASIGFGAWLGYRVGIEEGLLMGVARAALP